MKRLFLLLLLSLPVILYSQKKQYPEIDISYKKFVLDNGLVLVVHEDHKAPIVAFNIWYHVGSKNEQQGKTGFAHLFEHMMFTGSEHYRNTYNKMMDSIGATDVNGTSNADRTNFFETVPVNALDQVLWMESDRMGFLLKAIDSNKLNIQRGVVQNEKRQSEDWPYALSRDLTAKGTYPSNHPYSWSVSGSMADLDGASLTEVENWFKTYYGPNNATIVIAGDVKCDEVFEKIKKYFGEIPAGPPIAKHSSWIAKLPENRRQVAEDRVSQARLQKTWNIPGWGTRDAAYLNLLGRVLTAGKTSRLYKRLVYEEKLTTDASFILNENEIGSQFLIRADAKPNIELATVDKVLTEEIQKVITTGISSAELERVKMRYLSDFIKDMESVGGYSGKSDILAISQTYSGRPDYYKTIQNWIKEATPADIKRAAGKWLNDGEFVLEIVPYKNFHTAAVTLDRTQQPASRPEPVIKFPEVKNFVLSNGLKVAFVQRTSVPVVNMSLMVNAGYAADQFGLQGVASLTTSMLLEGTKGRTALQISEKIGDLGATLYSYADVDCSYLSMNALKSTYDSSLKLFADVLLNPAFRQQDFERVQTNTLLNIKKEQLEPFTMALRILPRLIYGTGHAYSFPFTGSGTEESVRKVSPGNLVDFHRKWFAPNSSTLVVIGDISENELKTKLEKNLGVWPRKTIPEKNIKDVLSSSAPSVYVIDKPAAEQSVIFAAEVSPSAKSPYYVAMQMANRILGSEFTSRINMNLRENKHWSYGAYSTTIDAVGPSFFTGWAQVQADKTAESMSEMLKEISEYVGQKPATEEEFKKVQKNAVLQLPGYWETNYSLSYTLQDAIKYERPKDYLNNYASMLQKLTLDEVKRAATYVIKPAGLTWVVVGDKSKIQKDLEKLKLGTIKYIDSEGNEINKSF